MTDEIISTLPRWSGSEYIGPRYDNCFVVCTRHRDSGVLAESNWRSILKHFEANPHIHYKIFRAGHWAVGWVEQILVEDHDIASICFAELIQRKLRDYPIFNEDDYSELESEKIGELVEMIRADITGLDNEEQLEGWEPITRDMTDDEIYDIVRDHDWVRI